MPLLPSTAQWFRPPEQSEDAPLLVGKSALDDIKCARHGPGIPDHAGRTPQQKTATMTEPTDTSAQEGNSISPIIAPRCVSTSSTPRLMSSKGTIKESLTQKQRLAIYAIAVTVLLLIAVSAILFLLRRRILKSNEIPIIMIRNILLAMLMTITTTAVKAQVFQFDEVSYSPENNDLQTFAPNDAKRVTLRIYHKGLEGRAVKTVKMSRTGDTRGRPM